MAIGLEVSVSLLPVLGDEDQCDDRCSHGRGGTGCDLDRLVVAVVLVHDDVRWQYGDVVIVLSGVVRREGSRIVRLDRRISLRDGHVGIRHGDNRVRGVVIRVNPDLAPIRL